jgi:hypothetical protein
MLEGSVLFRGLVLLTVVASSTLLVAVFPRHASSAVALVVVSTAACATLAVLERRAPLLGVRPIVAAIAVVFAVAIVEPPRTSNDLWSYSMYGRMVTVHSVSPYDAVPADFPSDPFLQRVSPIWQHRSSVFGPVFVAFAAAGTGLAGDSVLADRLYFQLAAALAAATILLIVWRRTRSPASLVWLGLHPVFGAVAINGGHIDIAIGLGVLAAALLCARRRGGAAGVVIGLIALVKITALLALVGVVLWAWRRSERRIAARALVGTAATVTIAYIPVLGSASRVLGGADHTVTSGSLWNPLADGILGHDANRLAPHPLAPNTTLDVIFFVALAAVAALALAVGWRTARASLPDPAIGATTASYTVAAEYTYPWYGAWALPVLTDRQPSRLAWIVWLQSAAMLAALKLPIRPTGTVPDNLLRGALTYAAPVALAIAFVVVGLRGSDRSLGVVPAEP